MAKSVLTAIALCTSAVFMSPSTATNASEPPLTEERAALAFGPSAAVGPLNVVQFWTQDMERLHREWAQPAPPTLTLDTATTRNKPITMAIIVGGCTPDMNSACNLTGQVEIFGPDGKPYGTPMEEISIWPKGQPALEKNVRLISPTSMTMKIEDGEKLGEYRVRLTVRDYNANIQAVTQQIITVVELQ